MKVNPFAGKPAQPVMLVDVPRLVTAYYTETPDASVPEQRVGVGTSRHRGSAFEKTFNEWHILAISQAICLYRAQQKIDGPLFLGMDTHALPVVAVDSPRRRHCAALSSKAPGAKDAPADGGDAVQLQ
ncbi:MAG: hypothetical protein ACYC3X_19675 [Pirellulaceae bacterium]